MIKAILVLFSIFFASIQLFAAEVRYSELEKDNKSLISSYSVGSEAEFELQSMNGLSSQMQTNIILPDQNIKLNYYEIKNPEQLDSGFILNLNKKISSFKTAIQEEYPEGSNTKIILRSLTWIINSKNTIAIWSISGVADERAFLAAAFSISVSAVFTMFEDRADSKWYRTNFIKKYSTEILKSYNLIKNKFFNTNQTNINMNKELFLRRLISVSLIDLAIITGYEIIKKFPGEIGPTMFIDVILTFATGVVVGYGFSFARSYLKDLVNNNKMPRMPVDIFSFSNRILLAAVYASINSNLADKTTVLLYVGLPGWTLAFLLYPSVRSKIYAGWLKFKNSIRSVFIFNQFKWKSIDPIQFSEVLKQKQTASSYYFRQKDIPELIHSKINYCSKLFSPKKFY